MSENMTSFACRRVRRSSTIALSLLIFWGCYLLAPLAVVVAASKLLPLIGVLIVLPTIPAIWLFPGFCALGIVLILWYVAGGEEAVNQGWKWGILCGAGTLTAVWFLPLWEESWPVAAAVVSPLRVSGLFDDPWLMGFSWLTTIPMMVYANLEGALDGTRSADTNGKRAAQPEPTSSARSTDSAYSTGERTSDESNRTSSTRSSVDLTYPWDIAPNVEFVDVGGLEELKSEVERSVLRPLTSTDAAYERFNISPPNGILLYGLPGTGKTHFARAIAGELGHPYLELSAGDLKSQWINESTEKVTQLFREAEQFERCVIFIDEIDALLAERENDLHHEHAQVVNEFLAQLDAEEPSFLLIAATNQVERLDEAATRRGRFDQQYEIELPDQDAREAIFRVRLRDVPTELDEQDYQQLAAQSNGLSSADIVGTIEDATINAAERGGTELRWNDFSLSSIDAYK